MSERFMPAENAITMHLSFCRPPTDGISGFSGFTKGISEARETTGRNAQSGEKLPNCAHDSWLGAIGYMALGHLEKYL